MHGIPIIPGIRQHFIIQMLPFVLIVIAETPLPKEEELIRFVIPKFGKSSSTQKG
jgi:hypothetical protein